MTDEAPIEEQVLHRVEDQVAWITLNRPDARNAITPDQRDRLIALLQDATASLDVRAVVITATGKGFCTGADLRNRRPAPPTPEGAPERIVGSTARLIRTGAARLIEAILDCEKPVLAAVNGTAAGIGLHKAKELVFFGDDLSAPDAERLGLINKVVPDGELEKAAAEWAQRLAAGPTKAIGLAKLLLNRSLDGDRNTALQEEAFVQEMVVQTQDSKEGMLAFAERRPPQFKGW